MCEAGEKPRHARSQKSISSGWSCPRPWLAAVKVEGVEPLPAGRFPRLLSLPRQLLRVPVVGRVDIRWSTLLSLEQTFLYKASPSGVLLPPCLLMLALSSHLQPSGETGVERKGSGRLTGDCESCDRTLPVQCCLRANVQTVSSVTSRSPPPALKKKK